MGQVGRACATYVDDRPTGATTAAKMSLADTTCGGVWDELSAWLSSTCTAEGSPWNWHARDHAPGQQTARETPNNSSRCTHRPRNKMRGAEEVQGEQATGARAGRVSLCTAGRQLRWAAGCGRTGRQAAGRWRERRRQRSRRWSERRRAWCFSQAPSRLVAATVGRARCGCGCRRRGRRVDDV